MTATLPNAQKIAARFRTFLPACAFILLCAGSCATVFAQHISPPETSSALTEQQREIERLRQRLASPDQEERRDAVIGLGLMQRPESSRVAAIALSDSSAIVRATAARAVLSLAPDEAALALIPALKDRDEFVRQEVVYALGATRSLKSVPALVEALENDKKESVRGASAVALGLIADERAVVPLTQTLSRRIAATGLLNRIRRSKTAENEFVRRSAARALGQIGSRAAVPALIAVLADEKTEDDVRREAAASLGLIGDPAAIEVLRAALTARDPYLARIAFEALRRIAPSEATRPT